MVKLLIDTPPTRVIVVPFALGRALGAAVGKMQWYSDTEFEQRAVEIVARELAIYYTRDYTEPSELYQELPDDEREALLATHVQVRISKKRKDALVKVYMGERPSIHEAMELPLDDALGRRVLDLVRDECE